MPNDGKWAPRVFTFFHSLSLALALSLSLTRSLSLSLALSLSLSLSHRITELAISKHTHVPAVKFKLA
jgi:hypothetical protein